MHGRSARGTRPLTPSSFPGTEPRSGGVVGEVNQDRMHEFTHKWGPRTMRVRRRRATRGWGGYDTWMQNKVAREPETRAGDSLGGKRSSFPQTMLQSETSTHAHVSLGDHGPDSLHADATHIQT